MKFEETDHSALHYSPFHFSYFFRLPNNIVYPEVNYNHLYENGNNKYYKKVMLA